VNTHAVVEPIRRRLAARCVGRDHEDFVTVAAEVLDDPKHRIGDAVDIREKGLRHDRNSHTCRLAAQPDRQVTDRGTRREDTHNSGTPGIVFRTGARKGSACVYLG
jgi:hypothetical protein